LTRIPIPKPANKPANMKHTDSFRRSLQDTSYNKKGKTKNKSSSPAEKIAVSSSEGTKEGTFECQYNQEDTSVMGSNLPPVKRATTVPLFVEPFGSRNLWAKESEATAEAMAPGS
jgi:hypothetical protein